MTEKLTKDECVKALNDLYFSYGSYGRDDECYNVLMELINEHFDNPPLSFEEMEKEMWVWDKKEKMYIHLINNYDSEKYGKGLRVQFGFDFVRYQFDLNRFYRKQVEE